MYTRNKHRLAMNCKSVPLRITPMLKLGGQEEAVQKSEVYHNPIFTTVKSYSGFLTVDGANNAEIFFWYFPAMETPCRTMIVQLQGGPGYSVLFDVFNGLGPFRLKDSRLEVNENEHSLLQNANLLYLDNPVGTGFSFTTSKEDYPTSSEEVADHLYSALSQFLQLFPEHNNTGFYLSGEGYGAKFALSLAKKIHELKADSTINLLGLILFSPYLDPEVIFNSNRHFLEVGLLDESTCDSIGKRLNAARRMANDKNFSEAMDIVEEIFGAPGRTPAKKTFYIPHITETPPQYNVLEMEDPLVYYNFANFINYSPVRGALHVGDLSFQGGEIAYDALRNDILRPSPREDLLTIMKEYRVVIFSGNKDMKTPLSLTSELLSEYVDPVHQELYKNEQKVYWKFNPNDEEDGGADLLIYLEKYFHHIVFFDCGHFVATEKTEICSNLINKFICNKSYVDLEGTVLTIR